MVIVLDLLTRRASSGVDDFPAKCANIFFVNLHFAACRSHLGKWLLSARVTIVAAASGGSFEKVGLLPADGSWDAVHSGHVNLSADTSSAGDAIPLVKGKKRPSFVIISNSSGWTGRGGCWAGRTAGQLKPQTLMATRAPRPTSL